MIECAYGRKFPELVLHFDGNIWIESYSIQLKKTQWRNRNTGQIVDEKPENLSNLKNMKMHVTLPTHPFIYSSKYGTWSNATFENGDEDYFEEISIGPCSHRHNHNNSNNASSSSSSFSLFDQDIKRKQQTKESRAMVNDNKEVRRNSCGSHKGLKLSAESSKPDSPRGTGTTTTAAVMPNSSRLSMSRMSSSSTSTALVSSTPRTPVTSASSSAALAESQAHAESLARDEAKSKHHTQLGSHFVKPGGSALLSRGSGSIRKLSIGTGATTASRSNSISADNTTAATTTTSGGGGIATLDSISEDISASHKASIFSPTRKDVVAAYSNKKFDDEDDKDNNKNASSNMRRPPPPPPPPRLPSPRDTAAASSSSTINNTPSMKLFLPVSSAASAGEDDEDDDEDGYNVPSTTALKTATSPAKATAAASSNINNNNSISPRPPTVPPPPPPLSPRQLAASGDEGTSANAESSDGITAVDTALHRSISSSTLTSSTQSKGNTASTNKSSGIIAGSAPTVVRPAAIGTGAVLDATQRNKEFFKRVKEQEEEEKRRKEQEVTQLDASTLAAIKEQELSADMHNNEKTKHYAKLGSTFTVKGPTGTAILQSRSKVTATPIPTAAATSK